jgi:hypothetical protein
MDEATPRMRSAARMNHAFGSAIFFIRDISIPVEDAAIFLEGLFGNLLAASHFEVEDHTLAGRAVLQKKARRLDPFLSGVCTSTCVSSAWM